MHKKCGCLITIVVSIVLGVLIGYIFSLGLLTGILIALWISLGAAVLGLLILIALILFSKKELDKCICVNCEWLAIGTLGALVLSVLGLSMTLAIGSAGIIILIGLLGAFLGMALISMAKLLCCLINSKYKYREN